MPASRRCIASGLARNLFNALRLSKPVSGSWLASRLRSSWRRCRSARSCSSRCATWVRWCSSSRCRSPSLRNSSTCWVWRASASMPARCAAGQFARLAVEHAQRAERIAFRTVQRHAGIEPQRHPIAIDRPHRQVRMRREQVVHDEGAAFGVDRDIAERFAARGFRFGHPLARLEPLPVVVDEGDRGHRRVAHHPHQPHDVVVGLLRWRVEDRRTHPAPPAARLRRFHHRNEGDAKSWRAPQARVVSGSPIREAAIACASRRRLAAAPQHAAATAVPARAPRGTRHSRPRSPGSAATCVPALRSAMRCAQCSASDERRPWPAPGWRHRTARRARMARLARKQPEQHRQDQEPRQEQQQARLSSTSGFMPHPRRTSPAPRRVRRSPRLRPGRRAGPRRRCTPVDSTCAGRPRRPA